MAVIFFICAFIYIFVYKSEKVECEWHISGNRSLPDENFIENYLNEIPISEITKILPERIIGSIWKSVEDEEIKKWNVSQWAEIDKEIIVHIPYSKLLRLNFKQLDIVEYLGSIECLSPKKLALLAAEYKDVIVGRNQSVTDLDVEIVKKSRNLFCGFPKRDYQNISPERFRVLVRNNVFQSLKCCSPETIRFLLKLAVKYSTIGPPSTWNSSTVASLGYLLTGLNVKEIRSVRFKSCSSVDPDVIQSIPDDTLKGMRLEQLLSLKKESLMIWRRRTLLTHHLYSQSVRNKRNIEMLILQFFYCIIYMYKI